MHKKYMFWVLIRIASESTSNEHPKHMFCAEIRKKKHYFLVEKKKKAFGAMPISLVLKLYKEQKANVSSLVHCEKSNNSSQRR